MMEPAVLKKYEGHIIAGLLLFFMAAAFVLRILPAIVTRDQAFFPIYDTDSWYTFRQIEVMVHHFPQYNWFDPMTAYPDGKTIDWGPLFPFLAAGLCILTGASTQTAIVMVSGYVSVVLAVLMIPVMYFIGTILMDRMTGLVAAGLIAVSSMLYFAYSSYGMADHHIAEVFFILLFFCVYLYTISRATQNRVEIRNRKVPPRFLILAGIAGVLYFLALITSTTVILVLLIVAVFTIAQGILGAFRREQLDDLIILNLVLLGMATALLFLFGFIQEGISFSTYSYGIVLLHAALAAESIVIWILSAVFRERPAALTISLAGVGAGMLVLSQIVPSFAVIRDQAVGFLFGDKVYSVGVQETLPMTWPGAFAMVNVGIFLAAAGFLVFSWHIWKNPRREIVFFAIWSVLMLVITVRHQRFLYYFTVNVVLLSALAVTEPLRWNSNPLNQRIRSLLSGSGQPGPTIWEHPRIRAKGKKKRPAPSSGNRTTTYLATACFAAVCILAIVHVAISVQNDLQYGMGARDREIPDDWIESLGWLRANTPETGIDYFRQYDQATYTPPEESYGIMAIWDAGHWITFFSRRPPITNPFQDHLSGSGGTAAFFLSANESHANSIIDSFRGRYVITDSSMAVDGFTNLVAWESGSTDISPWITWFQIPDTASPSRLLRVHRFAAGYFRTMVVRLHIFDGSMTDPTTAEYTTYTVRYPAAGEKADAPGVSRVITGERTVPLPLNNTSLPEIPEGEDLVLNAQYASILSENPTLPLSSVPALRHYRLIYESPHNASAVFFPESDPVTLPGIRMVKIFEYVAGARITGSGTIEVPVETNTGRAFTYRQESRNGEFLVPYATGATSGVHTTGPYRITGTNRVFTVTEEQVRDGLTVTG